MDSKGYDTEATYVRVVANWRRACDKRGLSELQRCHYNYDYILDEVTPWHRVICGGSEQVKHTCTSLTLHDCALCMMTERC